jgi:hypothetical protein
MLKLNLPRVTLVCVTSINLERAIKAINFSRRGINFGEVLLLTDKDLNLETIQTIKIESLDYVGYSRFIVYELHKYISNEHVILIQDDGFVSNPEKWEDLFLNYDYIGAPFPIPPDNDNISYRDPFGNLIRVGNGGFSLRSKKLLELPHLLNLEWKPYFGFYNEDGFFSVHNRHILEKNGCNFAPPEIAKLFSHEYMTPETEGITPFGFHGKHHPNYNLI